MAFAPERPGLPDGKTGHASAIASAESIVSTRRVTPSPPVFALFSINEKHAFSNGYAYTTFSASPD
jgi:hypothetical protein